jgi:isopentenyl phosphate kinase
MTLPPDGGTGERETADGPVVLKLGGSVVTRKDEPETVDDGRLDAAVDAIVSEDVGGGLVVVHGGGSFGHHHAERNGVSETAGTHDADAVTTVHGAMKRLNAVVVDRLQGRGVPAVPVHPFSLAHRDREGGLTMPTDGVETMLAEGFVPVLHGDGVVHAGRGVTVLSGDEIVTTVATALSARRVGLCSTVPGVLDADGNVVERVSVFEDVATALGGSAATDVTGGMAGKVRRLLDLPMPASVFGPDALTGFLAGETVGTTVDSRDRDDDDQKER